MKDLNRSEGSWPTHSPMATSLSCHCWGPFDHSNAMIRDWRFYIHHNHHKLLWKRQLSSMLSKGWTFVPGEQSIIGGILQELIQTLVNQTPSGSMSIHGYWNKFLVTRCPGVDRGRDTESGNLFNSSWTSTSIDN